MSDIPAASSNAGRICPGCFGTISLVETGTDDKGYWERWRCDRDCQWIPSTGPKARATRSSEVILRQSDYEAAASKRAKVADMIVADRRKREAAEKKAQQ